MSGPQFAHLQTWSLKPNAAGQSIEQIIAEANRDPEFSLHVDAPEPPRILLGDPSNFAVEHADHIAARSTPVKLADGSKKRRAIRTDRHTMLSIVMSYPVPRSAIITDQEKIKLAAWEKRNFDWLREKYGDQLRVVLAHDDEAHPHLHAWILPDDPGADATTLHPGKVAKKLIEAKAKADGVENREAVKMGNRALKQAMTGWQDEYHASVGMHEGLTRSGPKRRRLSRSQWQAEKATAKANFAALERAVQAEKATELAINDRKCEEDRAEKIRLQANAVGAAIKALSDEVEGGTIRRTDDGKLTAKARQVIKAGYPEISSAVNFAADLVMGMDAERAKIRDDRYDLERDQRALLIAEKEVETLRKRFNRGLTMIIHWLKNPDLTQKARKEAQEIVHVSRDLLLPSDDPGDQWPGF